MLMQVLLLADNNLIDFSKIFENGLIGVLIVFFAVKFVHPLLKSFLSTNEQNTKANMDNAVKFETLSSSIKTDYNSLLEKQEELRKETADNHKELLDKQMRYQERLDKMFQELLKELKENSS